MKSQAGIKAPKNKKPKMNHQKTIAAIKRLAKGMAKEAKEAPLIIKADEKGVVTAVAAPRKTLSSERDMARTMMGNRPIKTFCTDMIAADVGTVNTAYAKIYSPDLQGCPDATYFNSLFDEVRMISVEMGFIVYLSNDGTANQCNPGKTIVAWWDPTEGASTPVAEEGLQAQRHWGPTTATNTAGTNIPASALVGTSQMVEPRGHALLKSGPLDREMLPLNGGANPVGGMWCPCSATSLIPGYFKFYGEAYSANVAWATRVWYVFHVEYRFRS
jgi:hypothetical protein